MCSKFKMLAEDLFKKVKTLASIFLKLVIRNCLIKLVTPKRDYKFGSSAKLLIFLTCRKFRTIIRAACVRLFNLHFSD